MSELEARAGEAAAIAQAYSNYAEGLDSKNWPLVRRCFADEIYLDYGPMIDPGGSPDQPRAADDWMKMLQGVINGFDVTRHTITNHRFSFDGDSITCRAYLIADHVIFADPEVPLAGPEDVATVIGEYTNTYRRDSDGWKIHRSRLVIHYSTGNGDLFVTAAQRVAEQQGG